MIGATLGQEELKRLSLAEKVLQGVARHKHAINALTSGEVDMIETVAHDLLPVLEKDKNKNIQIRVPDHLGSTYVLRFNWKLPFDDLKVRRAAEYALNQPDFLKANIGDQAYFKECRTMFGCGATYETAAGSEGILQSNFEESKKLLKEAGYDGKPISSEAKEPCHRRRTGARRRAVSLIRGPGSDSARWYFGRKASTSVTRKLVNVIRCYRIGWGPNGDCKS